MAVYYPEGTLQNTEENRSAFMNKETLTEAMKSGRILEARAILCDSDHNLHVELGAFQGVIPREEGAVGIREGTVRDIALISRVNRPVCFTVQEITRDRVILSRRDAQERCLRDYLDRLRPGDVIDARITHLERFGAFADIGCGIVSLIPIDSISVSRISHPRERFAPDMPIRAVVKCRENGRITLTHKELLGTWQENAAFFSPGETVAGVVRSVESYGIFVELAPNLAGLAETRPGIRPGQQASVFIKSVLPARMKIKLILVDAFDAPPLRRPLRYFFEGKHMDAFLYSPPESSRQIISSFSS